MTTIVSVVGTHRQAKALRQVRAQLHAHPAGFQVNTRWIDLTPEQLDAISGEELDLMIRSDLDACDYVIHIPRIKKPDWELVELGGIHAYATLDDLLVDLARRASTR